MLITEYDDQEESTKQTSSNAENDELITDILEDDIDNIEDHILQKF